MNSDSAKRRLRRKVASQRPKPRPGHANWHDGALIAVFTDGNKRTHASALFDACTKLKQQGIREPYTMTSFKTAGGNTLSFLGGKSIL